MHYPIMFQSVTDHMYNGGPIAYNGAEKFMLPGDVIAFVMLCNTLKLLTVFSTVTCCTGLEPRSGLNHRA